MINSDHSKKEIAQAELDRRGTVIPTLEISGHAINRFSERFMDKWDKKVGLYTFILESASEALKMAEKGNEKVIYNGMTFVFDFGLCYPTLKTIM